MPRIKPSWQALLAPRSPADQWNLWFTLGLFAEGPFSWVRTHAFQPAAVQPGVPVASLEGFGATPDTAWMVGLRGAQAPVHAAAAEPARATPAALEAGDNRWHWGADDALTAAGALLGRPSALTASRIAGHTMPWIKLTGLAQFRTHTADIELRWGDETWRGAGLIGHAWGGYLPMPVSRMLPGTWQWDVLWEPGEPRRFYAAVTMRWLGFGFGPRAFRCDGTSVRAVSAAPVEVDAEDGGVPNAWRGKIGGKAYRAERSCKPLFPFKGGAYGAFTYTMGASRGLGYSEVITHGAPRERTVGAVRLADLPT